HGGRLPDIRRIWRGRLRRGHRADAHELPAGHLRRRGSVEGAREPDRFGRGLMARDYYQVLGVDRNATTEEIKKAFRKIARQTHPDMNPDDPGAAAKFREAAEAYEVLSDPETRRRYDRGDTIDLEDLLGSFTGFDDLLRSVFGEGLFGTGSRARRTPRGRDVLVRT